MSWRPKSFSGNEATGAVCSQRSRPPVPLKFAFSRLGVGSCTTVECVPTRSGRPCCWPAPGGADRVSVAVAEPVRRETDRVYTPRVPRPRHRVGGEAPAADHRRVLPLPPPVANAPLAREGPSRAEGRAAATGPPTRLTALWQRAGAIRFGKCARLCARIPS